MKILYNLKLRDNCDIGNFLIELCTSSPSSLIKTLAEQIKGIVLSPEVFDVLNKILKNDEENRSGEVQMLCELFSGERTSYRFASESTREIPANIPFVILGTTQLPFAAQVISSLDQGHGLLDRFLFFVPCCLRPTPEQTLAAKSKLCDVNVKSFTEIFWAMREEHLSKVEYGFTDSAKQMLTTLEGEFIQQLNESLTEGIMGPKS